jgi:hypothetical protein
VKVATAAPANDKKKDDKKTTAKKWFIYNLEILIYIF